MNKLTKLILGIAFAVGVNAFAYSSANAQGFTDPQAVGNNQVVQVRSLTAVEEDVDIGNLKIGTSTQVVTRYINEGSQEIALRDVNIYTSSNVSAEVSLNQCSQEPVSPGAECAIIVLVRAIQEGDFRVSVLLRHNGRSRLATGIITGQVDEADEEDEGLVSTEITANPTRVEFGELTASRPILRSVILRNVTTQPITINNIYVDSPAQSGFELRTNCERLLPSEACVASINWSPIVTGPSSGFLVVEHDGPSRISNVELTGEFLPEAVEQAEIFPSAVPGKGLLVSDQTEVDFGTDIDSLSAITLSLVNSGDAPLMIRSIGLSASDNGLKVLRRGCVQGKVLEPTEACPMTVAWSPSRVGSVIDDIRVEHTGARGVLVLPVRGTASDSVSLDNRPVFKIEGVEEDRLVDTTPSLDGVAVTSLAGVNAIIATPGGSRIVRHGTKILLGGVNWDVSVTGSGVELKSGKNEVSLVFDRSLSTRNATNNAAVGTEEETE